MPPKKRKQTPNRTLPLILILAGFLIIVGLLVYLAVSNPAPAQNTAADVPYPSIQRVTLADAKAALDAKSAVFVDVRDEESFKAGHIPGAVNIPLTSLEGRLNELPGQDQWIITYCT